jgi:hypothetical protein
MNSHLEDCLFWNSSHVLIRLGDNLTMYNNNLQVPTTIAFLTRPTIDDLHTFFVSVMLVAGVCQIIYYLLPKTILMCEVGNGQLIYIGTHFMMPRITRIY